MDNLQDKKIQIAEAPELKEVEESRAEQIRAVFDPMYKMLESFEGQYDEVISLSKNGITEDVTKKATTLRLAIKKVRTESEKLRKKQKEKILSEGKAIDGANNVLKWAIEEKESNLQEIENHFENEVKRIQAELQLKRSNELAPYTTNEIPGDIHTMPDDVWVAYLSTKKRDHEDRIAAEKAVILAKQEAERIERENNERLRLENERLKKESIERDIAEREERERREAEAARVHDIHQKEIEEREIQARKLLSEIKEKTRLENERLQKEKNNQKHQEMEDQVLYSNAYKICEMTIINDAKSFGLDVKIINDTMIELKRRMGKSQKDVGV